MSDEFAGNIIAHPRSTGSSLISTAPVQAISSYSANMGKNTKAKKRAASLEVLASKSSPLLEFVFDEPLVHIACHPEQPIVACAIGTGHVFCCKYDVKGLKRIMKAKEAKIAGAEDSEDQNLKKFWRMVKLTADMSAIEPEEGEDVASVELLWKTRRHKGSVRGLSFNSDGSILYTIGIDNVLKKANSMTGKVVKKVTLPLEHEKNKYTKLVTSKTHPFLLLGDERGNIYTLNSETLQIQNTIKSIHNGDAVNDIFQFIGKSVYKFISLGQTTLAYWDSRDSNESDANIPDDDLEAKRKVYVSDDQEDEMICGSFVNPEDGEVLVCGMGEGVLTVWKPKRNDLVDQLTRIPICKNESIDCVISSFQDDNCVYCGCSNGVVYKVNVKLGKVVEIRKHSSADEVYFIDLDYEYRVMSAGMDKAKLWDIVKEDENDDENISESFSDSDSNDSDSDSLSDSDSDAGEQSASDGEENSSSEPEEKDSDVEETFMGLSKDELLAELDKDLQSSDEEAKKDSKRTKKTQPKNTKKQKKELNNKQLRNLQKHEHGIRKFEGL
ncbi:unnamed protein product [Kluyveromyces dobzhanskii CBS 2104]|uniref:WD repeat-containing protein JIP5 n=1 Tax=Kluyveromyces dobzhanskii CBS 2104 TaxID=1427455 RepID=A0A0A8L2L5_9SACH|nr:unnamed protein product [Kluyveromyces dobzhanskii CBS 2104]